MTREEAKEALSVLKIYDNQWLREAVDMAIEALQAKIGGDLISRKDAIDAIGGDIMGGLNYRWILQSLPSAEAVQGWIPVSERLPDKEERILVTVWGDVDVAWRDKYGIWESDEYMYEKEEITAWRPLPEPYKGGDDK